MYTIEDAILAKGEAIGRAKSIVSILKSFEFSKEEIPSKLMSKLDISKDQAVQYYLQFSTKQF